MLSEERASKKFAALNQAQEILMWRYITSDSAWQKQVLALRIFSQKLKQSLMGSFWSAALGAQNVDSQTLRKALINARSCGVMGAAQKALATKSSIEDWEKAQQANDFSIAAPSLQRVVNHVRREARYKAVAMNISEPYDALLQSRTPGLSTALFDEIEDDLKIFCYITRKQAKSVQKRPQKAENFSMSEVQSRDWEEMIMRFVGYDMDKGTLARAPHPLCLGQHDDVRIGMRSDSDLTTTALTAAHEAGHGVYRQNLPSALKDSTDGQLAGVGMDEAMALIMENHVVRDKTFTSFLAGKLREEFNQAAFENVTGEHLYQHMKHVDDHPIRTEADEIRYPLDVILRYRIERDLVNGDMEVAEIPSVWAQEYKKLTGIEIMDDNQGALQDIHWFGGEFGWFPNYLIGQLVAAQLFEAAAYDMPSLATELKNGNVSPLREWLETNVYSKGATRNTFEIVEDMTGHKLSTVPYKRHIGRRYLSGWPWSKTTKPDP